MRLFHLKVSLFRIMENVNIKNLEKWSKVYDLIYRDYQKDINFYKKEAKKASGRVLEIACGTGRIYLELLKEGIDIYGIDLSKDMLKVLKEKAKIMGLRPKVKKADMRNFKFGHKFSLILVPFGSFLFNLTSKEQIKTLINIKRHLIPGGRLILDFFYPDPKFITKTYGKWQKRIIKDKNKKLVLVHKTYFIDEPNQIVELMSLLKEGNKVILKFKLRLALVYKKEFELLLNLAGFKKWKVYGGFNYQPIDFYKERLVWIVENKN